MIDIMFEDESILVVKKPAGMESQSGKTFAMDMVSAIKNELSSRNRSEIPYIGVVHRLDRPVSGVMVYAKTPNAAGDLSCQIQNRQIRKRYYALICGKPEKEKAILTDYLGYDKKKNRSWIADASCKQAKKAILHYQIVPLSTFGGFEDLIALSGVEISELSLADIELITGRHHQIRLQLSHAGVPILGDTKYNPQLEGRRGFGQIGLCAYQLEFLHPVTGKKMTFTL